MDAQKVREQAIESYKAAEQKADNIKKGTISSYFQLEEHARRVLSDFLGQKVTSPLEAELGNYSWHLSGFGNAEISWDSLDWHTDVGDLHFIVRIEKDRDSLRQAVAGARKGEFRDTWYVVYMEIDGEVKRVPTLTHVGRLLAK